MSDQVEKVEINTDALEGVEVDQQVGILAYGFHDAPTKVLLPIILPLHQLWKDDQAQRILAFFYDNTSVLSQAKSLMGLDVLAWGPPMYEEAVENDNFNKLVVLAIAQSFPPVDDASAALREAIEGERFGMALALLATKGNQIATTIGPGWVDTYKTLADHQVGVPYFCAQILNGTMAHHAQEVWEADLPKVAETLDADVPLNVRIDYLAHQGQMFGGNPTKRAVEFMANQ